MANKMNEQERREAALASLGGEVLAAREVAPREIRQMLSVRLEPRILGDLREISESRGIKISDLVREAIARLIAEFRGQDIRLETWSRQLSVHVQPMVEFSSASPTNSPIESSFVPIWH